MFKIFSSCLILFWLSCPYLMIGQDRHDNYWVLGDQDKPPIPYQSRAVLNFNSGKPEFEVLNHKAYMFECNVMSDKQGKLQFYHDGCHLFHHGYEIMDGGYMLNPGYDHDRYCGPEQRYPYYPLRNGSVAIPDPFRENLYHLIHLSRDENLQIGILYHSRIDMSLNNGYGKLVEKVKVSERLSYTDGIQSIRHGNGRDWWIIS